MRKSKSLLSLALAAATLTSPFAARAWVAVRVHAVPVVVVHPVPPPVVVVVPAPTTVVVTPPPAQAVPKPEPLTTKLPIDTTMWTLPSNCTKVAAGNQTYWVCGENWLKAYPGPNGSTYYGVVAPP
jgi:hypothetical protein